MARALTLSCVENADLELLVEEDESAEGTSGIMFSVGDNDEGVLLLDGDVDTLVEWLEEWRVRQKGKSV